MSENRSPSKKRRWLRNLMVLFVVAVLMLGGSAFALLALLGRGVEVKPGSILEIKLSGGLSEGPKDDLLAGLTGDARTSLWDLRRALRAAAEDKNISGIRLSVEPLATGWGAAEEILAELDRFRSSGKPIHTLFPADFVEDLDYFVGTGGDQLWITPDAFTLVNGLAAEVSFWRGSLEKLGIEPEVIMFKEYKSAGEPFANREMSPHMREALTAVLEEMDQRFKGRVSERRAGVTPEGLSTFLARGMASAKDVGEAGLVDHLGYVDEVNEALRGVSGAEKYEGIALSKYLRSLKKGPRGASETIAVVYGEGPILSIGDGDLFGMGQVIVGPELAGHIRKAAEDEKVKAIVFRVNSPGGSAVGSDVVRREIRRAREQGKPVVVSMSSVAGSGGYWISMDADAIVAATTTITGSIGVVFTKFNLNGFMDWVGMNVDTISTAPLADLFGTAPLDPERRKLVEGVMGTLYESFKGKVASSRGRTPEEVETVARGRIWSGRDALERGLVDRVGGIDAALALAKEKAGLDPDRDYPLVVYPKPKSFVARLLEGDLSVQAPRIPSEAELRDWAEEHLRSEVLARMPDIRVW